MPPILVDCPPSNGGALLLVGTTMVDSVLLDVVVVLDHPSYSWNVQIMSEGPHATNFVRDSSF